MVTSQEHVRRKHMTPDEFIQAKRNAMATKTERKLWLESKINTYQIEANDIDYVLKRDDKVLGKLEAKRQDHEDRSAEVKRRLEQMAGLTGPEFDLSLKSYMLAKTALEELEAEMRSIYYAK